MMLEVIAFHARRSPASPAIHADGVELTYGELLERLSALIAALRSLPISPGKLVGVACPDDYLHFMTMLALEALGVVTLPFMQPSDPGIDKVLVHCDLILAPEAPVAGVPFGKLTPQWLRAAMAVKGIALAVGSAVERRGYVLTTSGTTGAAKAMRLPAKALTLREHDRIWQYGLHRASRFVVAMPITVGGVYSTARACLRMRGCVMFQAGMAAAVVLARATHIVLLPIHVRHLLDVLPQDYAPTHPLVLISMGARLSLALRSRAVGKLHATVHDGYGANETGPISVVDADGAGDILPDVEVEVVDDEGKVLPDGELGRIRVRSASQISGYLEPEHDRRYLQGGWFDTGDMGKIVSPRRLLVLGRPDAMLNVGGLKVAAEEIEDLLMRGAIAGDSAVCTIPGPDGIHELYVAVVDAPGDDSQLATAVGRHLGGNFGHIRILRLNKIPRGSGGKVLRLELARLVASLVGQAR